MRYLVRLVEMEPIDRERRMIERRIRQARFPAVKSLDSFDFKAIASLNKMLVLELARGEYIERHENVIGLGNSGTGKTHAAPGLGLAACQKGLTVGFVTAAALVHEPMEARDEKCLPRYQKQLAKYKLPSSDLRGATGATVCSRHRRTRLRAAVQDWSRAAVRDVQPALRAPIHPGDQQPALRRMDGSARLRAPDRGIAGPIDPPRAHPGNEWRQLPAQRKPKTAEIPKKRLIGLNHRGHGCPGGSTGTTITASRSFISSGLVLLRPSGLNLLRR